MDVLAAVHGPVLAIGVVFGVFLGQACLMGRMLYKVTLSEVERGRLREIAMGRGGGGRIMRKRALMLLALDTGLPVAMDDAQAAKAAGLRGRTSQDVRRLFALEGLEAALRGHPRKDPPVPPKLCGELEARLVRLACSEPLGGRSRWTVRLLAERISELESPVRLSKATVRRALGRNSLRPWKREYFVIPP